MWWLILDVNLTELRDAQIIGKALFLEVSMGVFPDEISIWISGLRNVPQMGEHHLIHGGPD